MKPFRSDHHRHGFGQQHPRRTRYDAKKVAICEQGTFGGTCLNVGCIPHEDVRLRRRGRADRPGSRTFGIDAHIDGVRWGDIVSRVFGRIDPIALGGELSPSSPNVTVFDSHTRFAPTQSDGRYVLRTEAGDEFTSDQVVIAAGRPRGDPAGNRRVRHRPHTSDTIMRIAELPEHLVIVGGGFVAAEFAHVFSALGSRVTIVMRGCTLLRAATTTSANGLPTSPPHKWELRSHRNVVARRPAHHGSP